MELEPEGYALASRGLPEILKPVQDTVDWLVNTHFYNVRKTLNDQFVVDPSRVMMKDVTDPLPGGIIRLKPSAYGSDTRTAISQLAVTDVTRANMSDLDQMIAVGARVSGVHDQLMGLVEQTGRRTATESRISSTFGVNRLKTHSEFFSALGFSPMAQMMVQNSQQYYDAEMKFRLVGDLIQEAGSEFIQVDPSAIQGFYNFVPVDGTLPIDRFAQANLWRELMAQMGKTPGLLEQYDIGRIFAWVAQLAGLKNINQFKIQVRPDEQLAQQAQRGNIIPIPGGTPPAGPGGVIEPGQISGLGTTG